MFAIGNKKYRLKAMFSPNMQEYDSPVARSLWRRSRKSPSNEKFLQMAAAVERGKIELTLANLLRVYRGTFIVGQRDICAAAAADDHRLAATFAAKIADTRPFFFFSR